jgi:ABC-type multidrug transport system, ATPase and permease components
VRRLLTDYLRPYWRQLILVVSLVAIQAIANLYLPDLNAKIIDNGVSKGDTAYIVRVGGLMLVVALLMGLASIVSVYWSSKTSMSFGRDVRGALFRQVENFSQSEINQFGTPSLITRNTNDVQQVQTVLTMALTLMVMAPMMMIGGIFMALRQDVPLSALLIVILPIIALVVGTMVRKGLPLFRAMQIKIDVVNQVTRETLTGIRVIRAFVRGEHEERRFDEANLDLTDTSLRVARLFALMMPLLLAIFNLSTVAVMWFGGHRVADGGMPIGNLIAFLTYVMQILFSVMMATVMFAMIPRAAASADRIQQVLDVQPSIADPPTPRLLSSLDGKQGFLEFKEVEFRYPGAEDAVLKNVSFSIAPGETTAIVGSTGSGKSTLVNLIPRFYDVTAGSVEIDGVDVREMAQNDLWGKIGFVPQKAFLFSGTVASNLRYGDEQATDAALWHALDVAQGREFVGEMSAGLESPITQGGTNVSGGQRQRLAVARAIVKKPEIYVLDDSLSALDFKTDSALRAALRNETADATVIIVAQRVGTIMHADRIIVMDQGTVVGQGTHDELMQTNETYREIVFSQLSQEEVA